jgi:hypothetical protein
MSQGSIVIKDGVRVIQGTPAVAIARPTLFLRMWRVTHPAKPPRTFASLHMVRPSRGVYIIKELIPETDLDPRAALDKAVAIARRGDVAEIYLNADLGRLPAPKAAAAG